MRTPKFCNRANSMAQPGSSTITQSPGRSKVRLMMSSAWVAPTVVINCCGAACSPISANLADSTSRKPLSPWGSP